MGCLTPPLSEVPEAEWYCPTCIELGNDVPMKTLEDGTKTPLTSHIVLLASGVNFLDETPENNVVEVRIILNDKKFVPPSFESQFNFSFLQKLEKADCAEDLLDTDFDEYICSVCKKSGDVFYCDTCPKLFHEKCIPYGPAKLSFERGESTWNCHKCIQNGYTKALGGSRSQRNRKKCVECKKIGGKMDNCSYCGACFHPFCRRFQSSDDLLCTSCRNTKDISEHSADNSGRVSTLRSRRVTTPTKPIVSQNNFIDDDDEYDEDSVADERNLDDMSASGNDSPVSFRKSKPRMIPIQVTKPMFAPKKRTRPDHLTSGQMKPTPGFFLYLIGKQTKLENTLSRRVKKFKKLDELEQHMLIAKEAAICWSREALKVRRSWDYDVSTIFNHEVRNWVNKNAPGLELAAENGRKRRSKSLQKQAKKSRLSESNNETTIIETFDGGGHVIFFDLLQDIRFHPLPIFGRADESQEFERPQYEKMTIAKFFVQGPFSTSIGDDCVGCTRGWCHFCPVLKRMLPAVEHRSRLQPPTSTLVATRIALNDEKVHNMGRRDCLNCPDERIDDLTLFVEDMANINNPSGDDSQKYQDKGNGIGTRFQCKCGSITHSVQGCNQCRRKMVLNKWIKMPASGTSKVEKNGESSNNIMKIESMVLFRAPLTANKFDELTENDRNIAKMLCHQKWKPIKMLSGDRSKPNETLGDDSGFEQSSSDKIISKIQRTLQNSNEVDKKDLDFSRRSKRSSIEPVLEKDAHKLEEEARARLEATQVINKRCRLTAINGVFLACLRRDPLRLFAEPVRVPGYESVIMNPIDMGLIRNRIIQESYTSFGSFTNDMKLLCDNAILFNPPDSIYAITAKDIRKCLDKAQKKAKDWMDAVKNCHSSYQRQIATRSILLASDESDNPFAALDETWPGASDALDRCNVLEEMVKTNFLRTKENENAYYGSLAIRRAVMAASTAITSNILPVVSRSVSDDENMRNVINENVKKLTHPERLLDEPGWRETGLLNYLHTVQNRRVELKNSSKSGCARTDEITIVRDTKLAMMAEALKEKRNKSKSTMIPKRSKIHPSRSKYGMASQSLKNREEACKNGESAYIRQGVDVRGSVIHGWGLFAERDFMSGEIVAEYLGEYVSNEVADKREKIYQQRRIEDYQFRVNADLVIDATFQGGPGRYINHSCSPSCIAEIIDGTDGKNHLKRVMIKANRNISEGEEITYDYQFPLELDLSKRIPCNCGSDACRGYMNWDLPEKSSEQVIRGVERIRDRSCTTLKGKISRVSRKI